MVHRGSEIITLNQEAPNTLCNGVTHLKWSLLHNPPPTHILFYFLACLRLNSVSTPKSKREFFSFTPSLTANEPQKIYFLSLILSNPEFPSHHSNTHTHTHTHRGRCGEGSPRKTGKASPEQLPSRDSLGQLPSKDSSRARPEQGLPAPLLPAHPHLAFWYRHCHLRHRRQWGNWAPLTVFAIPASSVRGSRPRR